MPSVSEIPRRKHIAILSAGNRSRLTGKESPLEFKFSQSPDSPELMSHQNFGLSGSIGKDNAELLRKVKVSFMSAPGVRRFLSGTTRLSSSPSPHLFLTQENG